MEKQAVTTSHAPLPLGPYSQAIKAGDFIFCSGQIAVNPESGNLVTADIESETVQVLENLKAVLEEAGSSLDRVVKTAIFLRDINDFAQVNAVYKSYFTVTPPARSTVQVAGLPKGAAVEIECIALTDSF